MFLPQSVIRSWIRGTLVKRGFPSSLSSAREQDERRRRKTSKGNPGADASILSRLAPGPPLSESRPHRRALSLSLSFFLLFVLADYRNDSADAAVLLIPSFNPWIPLLVLPEQLDTTRNLVGSIVKNITKGVCCRGQQEHIRNIVEHSCFWLFQGVFSFLLFAGASVPDVE